MHADVNKMSNRFGLTRRETDVLKHVLRGMKNADIADNLEISVQTVKDHLSKIYRKLGLGNRFDLMHSLVKTSNERVTVLSKNITELKQAAREVREASLTDELTGLYNRKGFFMLAEHHLKVARRHKTDVYVVFADVDNLRAISDTFGRIQADGALRETANILVDTFRESDIIARVGDHEFAVIPLVSIRAAVDGVVARLQEGLELFNADRKSEYTLSMRCCISCHRPGSDCSPDELLFRTAKSPNRRKKTGNSK